MEDNRNNAPIPPAGYCGSDEDAGFLSDSYQTAELEDLPVFEDAPERMSSASQGEGYASSAKGARSKAPRGGTSLFKTFLAGFTGAALACGIAGGCFAMLDNGQTSGSSTVLGGSGSSIVSTDGDQDRAEAVANKVLPSIVGIDVYTSDSGSRRGGFLTSGESQSLVYTGLGSGVIISKDGYIITNYHVVEGADALRVTANGQEYEGSVVGTDELSDLAVVKIDAEGLAPIEIGDSSSLVPGQWVMAAGSPFGLEQSVATGIVSATSRTVTVSNSSNDYSYYYGNAQNDVSIYSNMIQTDAAINPGNSGGALVDANGKLIGINSVIESASGNYAGVGFAIPSDYAISIAQQIIEGKTPTHAQLGVAATTIDSSIAQRYDMPVESGAYLSAVYQGSPAAEAGLQEGDIIIAIDGTKIESSTDLVAACRGRQVGDEVEVTFVRDGKESVVAVELGSDENSLE